MEAVAFTELVSSKMATSDKMRILLLRARDDGEESVRQRLSRSVVFRPKKSRHGGAENIEISIIEEEIEVGWSNFTSKCYYRGENSNGLEMLLHRLCGYYLVLYRVYLEYLQIQRRFGGMW
ncbi:hypothetical protein YC2023_109164 [Brassica napus]